MASVILKTKLKEQFNMKTKNVVTAGVIASLYVVLTLISAAMGLSGNVIQLRRS